MSEIAAQNILYYQNFLLYENITSILEELWMKLNTFKLTTKTKKKVYKVANEGLESIYFNGMGMKRVNAFVPSVEIKMTADHFEFKLESAVGDIEREKLELVFQKSVGCSISQLHSEYMESIINDNHSYLNRIELGILEIAKASEGELNYTFASIQEKVSKLTLNIKLKA